MDVKIFYSTAIGRLILKGIMDSGLMPVAAGFLRRPVSKALIGPYIRHNRIDMSDFRGQDFRSFADFFRRKKSVAGPEPSAAAGDRLISPCDGKLSVYPIREDSRFFVKGSWYRVSDLIPDQAVAEKFMGGSCFIYRLEAADYHHFCYIDDCYHSQGHRIEGMLHSVQPIACEKEPVYRLNRRMWSLMETENFGPVAQIEVGALLVGGIVHEKGGCRAKRGEEMGHFELAGSTIIQLFTEETSRALMLRTEYGGVRSGKKEVCVRYRQEVGRLRRGR